MKASFQLMFALVIVLGACADKSESDSPHGHKEGHQKELIAQIDSLEAIHQQKGDSDKSTISKLISAYSEYRNKYREDKRTPSYFLKAGDLAMSIEKWEKAAEIQRNFFNDYESHPNRDDVLFQLGFIYDFQLNQKNKAKQTYEHYFKLYGDSIHIEQVRARLEDLNLTDKELIEKFRKKNNLD